MMPIRSWDLRIPAECRLIRLGRSPIKHGSHLPGAASGSTLRANAAASVLERFLQSLICADHNMPRGMWGMVRDRIRIRFQM